MCDPVSHPCQYSLLSLFFLLLRVISCAVISTYPFLWNVSSYLLTISNWFLFPAQFGSFLSILDTSLLLDLWFPNVVSQLLIAFSSSLHGLSQTSFSFNKAKLTNFPLYKYLRDAKPKTFCLNLDCGYFLLWYVCKDGSFYSFHINQWSILNKFLGQVWI